jgi:hypothetical protein
MTVLGHWTGEDAYRDWIDRGGGFTEFEWKAMNVFDRARWEQFADRLNEQHRGAVEAERKRVVEYLRSRAADKWDPSSEASLQRVAEEIARDHHHGGR